MVISLMLTFKNMKYHRHVLFVCNKVFSVGHIVYCTVSFRVSAFVK